MSEGSFGRSLERKHYFKLISTYFKLLVVAQAGYHIQMGCFQRMAEKDVQVVTTVQIFLKRVYKYFHNDHNIFNFLYIDIPNNIHIKLTFFNKV